mmetsp:Transcript_38538/g.28393  ORF Transcript_38538/g.28393 Transcript_38538/m.28393 type:complete len:102 (-) Transcript_38538:372-677(-)
MAERKGGPTDALSEFDSVFESLFKGDKNYKNFQSYPLYQHLAQISAKASQVTSAESKKDVDPALKEEVKEGGSKWKRNYDKLEEKDRQEMLVDEIFALYLF